MNRLTAILCKEFLVLSRDWHGLVVLFLMPAAFILIMSLALRDTYNIDRIGRVTLAVLDLDQSAPSRQLASWLNPTASAPASIAELEQWLRMGTVGAGIVIEAGYAAALSADKVRKPVVLVLADTATRPEAMAALRGRIEGRIAEQRARVLLNSLASISILIAEDLGARLAAVPPAALISTEWVSRQGRRALSATQQNVPAWLVFGMFFVVIPICNVFIREKQHGTLARLATLRVSLPLLLVGKILPYVLINMVQTVLMLLVGRFLVPLLGGEPLPLDINWLALGLMAMSVSAAAIGFALLVAAVARTTEHATVLGGLANILFGAIGGIMVPRAIMPPFMQELARVSPMNWGLEGFLEVFVRRGGAIDVGPFALILTAMGLLCLLLAMGLLRRQMRR